MKKQSAIKKVTYFWVFLLLCLSGNPLLCINPHVREIYAVAAVMLLVYRLFSNGGNPNVFLKYIIPFVLISICQIFALGVDPTSALFLIMKLYIGFAILQIVGRSFIRSYVDVMFALALISLPLFAYNTFFGLLPGYPFSEIGTSLGVYTQLAREGYAFIDRNAGMFWEPGAFQGYLNIALAFLLLLSDVKHKKLKAIVIIAAVLTTKSSTGYLVLGLLLLYYTVFTSKQSILKKTVIVVSMLVVYIYAYTSLDFLQEKMVYETSKDIYQGGRINDYARYGSLILSNFFIGLSANVADIAPTGNGFVSFLLYYGIFGVSYYFIAMYKKFSRQVNHRTVVLLTLLIFLTLQGEGFIYYPLYLVFPLLQLEVSEQYRLYA